MFLTFNKLQKNYYFRDIQDKVLIYRPPSVPRRRHPSRKTEENDSITSQL